jgi:hypothetical protein
MEDNAEQNWIERAKNREPAAIAELFRRYWRAARAGQTIELTEFSSSDFFGNIDR